MAVISLFAVTMLIEAPKSTSAIAPYAAAPEDQLEVCRRSDGQLRNGSIDVVVLLDNSTSLKDRTTTDGRKRQGSDPTGKRFDAIKEFLEAYQQTRLEDANGGSERRKRFGLVAFEQFVTQVIDMQQVESDEDVSRIYDRIEKELRPETQRDYTDYVTALQAARDLFSKADSNDLNCRILVWFTDGEYDPTNNAASSQIAKDAEGLRETICRTQSGLAEDYDSSDINTFVVYLDNGSVAKRTDRAEASRDAMQAITGDPQPSFIDADRTDSQTQEPGTRRQPVSQLCKDSLAGRRHLGEIIGVSDAKTLVSFLVDLVNTADGGQKIFEEECPLKVAQDETREFPLIDGHLIDWVSITSWGDQISDEDISIVTENEDVKLVDSETIFRKSVQAKNTWRLVPKDGAAREKLSSGWKVRVNPTETGVCVQIKTLTFEFTIQASDELNTTVNPEIPKRLYEGQLEYVSDGRTVSFEEAKRNPAVSGELKVAHGEFLEKPGRLPVRVKFDGAMQIESPCAIRLQTSPGNPPDSPIRSNRCWVISSSEPSATEADAPGVMQRTEVDAESLIEQLNNTCSSAGNWALFVDGRQQEAPVWQSVEDLGGRQIPIEVGTTGKAQNREIDCAITEEEIEVRSTTASGVDARGSFVAEFDLEWPRKSDGRIALLFALAFTFLGAGLSLLLLRVFNQLTAKTVDTARFFAFKVDGELRNDDLGRTTLNLAGMSSRSFVGSADNLHQISGGLNRTEFSSGDAKFVRRMPGFFRPFEEARLVYEGPKPAVFWRSNPTKDGLNLAFPFALIASATQLDASGISNAKVRLTALIPKSGRGSGVDGAQQLIREHGDDLAIELAAFLAEEDRKLNSSEGTSAGMSPLSQEKTLGPEEQRRAGAPAPKGQNVRPPESPVSGQFAQPPGTSRPPQPPQPPRPPQRPS